MSELTPDQRLEAFRIALEAAGGTIITTEPLAHPDAPTVLVAYKVSPGYLSRVFIEAVDQVITEHASDLTGLVPLSYEEEVVVGEVSDD